MTVSRAQVLTSLLGTAMLISVTQITAKHGENTNITFNLTEAEYLALEGGSLLPDPEAVSKVSQELTLIREKFSVIRNITHNRKWMPGQVLSTTISPSQIARLNESSYGPLKNVERIDVMPFFYVTVVTFDKPYSPPVLSKQFETEFGISCTPNTVYYEYEVDNIGYRMTNSTYIFKRGTGMCKDNCPDRYLWEFMVEPTRNVTLVKEWSVPQNGERVVIN